VEGEGREDEVAFDCAGNLLQGGERKVEVGPWSWRWDKDQNLAEGAAWGCGSTGTVSPLLRSKRTCGHTPSHSSTHMTRSWTMTNGTNNFNTRDGGQQKKGFKKT
jgi:hypothetical protein